MALRQRCPVPEPTDYHGPPRTAEDVIRSAFSNPELMRQLMLSYEEELQGIPPVPFRQVQEELREQEARQRRTA